jgi:valyl-tRNA synthetase
LDLYKKGRIYREESPAFWCSKCQTALAQADLEDRDEKSTMFDIEFKFENGDSAIISTTRPELIPACVALYVNPKDSRYTKYVGGKAIVPLTQEKVPVKTSSEVETEKGTGLMMVCTWGDTEDIEKWKSDKLDTKLILDKNGKLNEKAGKYSGMKLDQARESILKDLENEGLLKNKIEINHTLNIHERCKHPIEFFVSPQWFIKVLDLKDELKKRGEELKWHPKFMKTQLDNWIDGLKWDWCISRDRFYGVPFPLWHCEECGEIILAHDDELPVDPRENLPKAGKCSKCGSKKIKGEMQVLDTWATSSTTPLINNHWREIDEKNVYPMSVRVQGFEIIRTWLFYTLVKSHLNTDSIPWKNVMISGWGLAKNGEKMSKSLNNFVTAESMLEKYGADAVRFWSCGANLGMNLRFSEDDMRAGQKLLTKFWNATRFVMINLENYEINTLISEKDLETSDQWILSELQDLIQKVTDQFENYEFAKAKILLEHFFWIKFTDSYIELIKGRLYGEDEKGKLSSQFALFLVISTLNKLFAPILPHLSEEIYQQFFKSTETSIHLEKWPKTMKNFENKNLLENGKMLLEIISEIRKQKAENNIKLGENFKKMTIESDSEFVLKIKNDLKNMAHADEIEIIPSKKLKLNLKN